MQNRKVLQLLVLISSFFFLFLHETVVVSILIMVGIGTVAYTNIVADM